MVSEDLAGSTYWDQVWDAAPKSSFDPDNSFNRATAKVILEFLEKLPKRSFVLEAGCGDSIITTYVNEQGFVTGGIDYSIEGCRKFKEKNPKSVVYQADIFAPPHDLLGAADGVFSLGLVEHFTDTKAVISALAKFMRPAGVMLTAVPNMNGTVGLLQKWLNRRAYDVHLPLTPSDLEDAHEGMKILASGYFGGVSYGVVNPGRSIISRFLVGVLARASRLPLALGVPSVRSFAPYCYCIAQLPEVH